MIQLQHRLEADLESSADDLNGGEWTTYLPTQEEIERCCQEIRSGWSESEHRRRAGLAANRLHLAVFPCRTHLPSGEYNPRDFEVLS